ncbi:MAG: RNA polymerase sporulation sigma factor SigK [Clostridia bacterium]|nr:RNA polymerase sporulation sigma factor SigK [Clostridia bacterium]
MWPIVVQFLSQMFFMVLQVVNSGSFPKPLTARQEREALAAMAAGDRAARQRLVEHNLRLVAHIIKKHYSGARDQEDLISIGTIGLIKAVDTFDAAKGQRLAAYASRCIENEILMHFRAARKTEKDVSLSEPIDTDSEGRPLTLMDVLAQEDTILEDLDQKINLHKLGRYLQECLEERELEILRLRYGLEGEPLAQWQVAQRLGISRSYVSRLETRALDKLRRRYEKGDVRR